MPDIGRMFDISDADNKVLNHLWVETGSSFEEVFSQALRIMQIAWENKDPDGNITLVSSTSDERLKVPVMLPKP